MRTYNMEEILGKALDIALEKKDPLEKLKRRQKRETAKKKNSSLGKEKKPIASRYVPSEVRERVFERAGYRCEYQSGEGVRCSCRTGLQIEHTLPFAVYHTNDEKHLLAFCPAHNHFAAETYYGRKNISQKVKARKQEKLKHKGIKQTAQVT